MQLNLSKSYENRIKIEKCMKNGLHVRFKPLEFRSELPFSDRKFQLPIGFLEIRSEIWNSDRNSGFPIGNPVCRSDFQFFDFRFFFFLQKLIKEKNKKENAFEAKKYPV